MQTIYNFFQRNRSIILHLFFTSIICILLRLLNSTFTGYQFLENFILTAAAGFCIYRILFLKKYADSALKLCCLSVLIICVNEILSFMKLQEIFPWMKKIDENSFWPALFLISALLLVGCRLFLAIASSYAKNKTHALDAVQEVEPLQNHSGKILKSTGQGNATEKNNVRRRFSYSGTTLTAESFHYLKLTGIILLIVFLLGIPAFLLFLFNRYHLDAQKLEFDKVLSFFMSYGLAFLLILYAVIFVLVSLLHIIKYIFALIASFGDTAEQNDSSRQPPLYAFSVAIVLVLLSFSWKIASFNMDDLTEVLIAGDYLAFPLAAIILLILFFLMVNIVHTIITTLNGKSMYYVKVLNRELQLSEKIQKIIKLVVSIILDTIISTCGFIQFIPHFFSALSGIVLPVWKDSEEKHSQPDRKMKQEIEIIQIAAFSFAILSWLATAQGMHQYVFQEYYWQALLVSFGIQSILFVFNLRLPYYFHKIGEKTAQREKRRYHFGEKRGMEKNTYKWTAFQKLTAVFYAIVLFSSSFFSFVYITNLVYRDTQYVDAHAVLTRNYNRYLRELDEYSSEYSKVCQLSISTTVSDLQELIPASDNGQRTLEELQAELSSAEEEHGKKVAEQNTAKETYNMAKAMYETPMTERWRDAAVYRAEYNAVKDAIQKQKDAQDAVSLAGKAVEDAENALKNYKPSADTVVHEILLESLKIPMDQENLNEQVNHLKDLLLQDDQKKIAASDFSDIVARTHELSILVNNYQTLTRLQYADGESNDITDLQETLLSADIPIPVPSSEEFETQKAAWISFWKERFTALEKLVNAAPDISPSTIRELDEANSIINTSVLLQFDVKKAADEISRISRSNLENINAIERAVGLLFHSPFPALAIFSALFALFLDLASLLAGLFIYLTEGKCTSASIDSPSECM